MDDEEDEYDVLQKVLIVGDTAVGKTCLLLRFCSNEFRTSFLSTIGIDFRVKVFETSGTRVKMQVWDTAGQERFRTITHTYFRGASGIFLVYDVANAESFQNVKDWSESIDAFADEAVVRVIIGNKADTEDSDRQVTLEEGGKLAEGYGVSFCETSAKSGANVEKMFHLMAKQIMAMHADKEQKTASSRAAVQVGQKSEEERKPCAC